MTASVVIPTRSRVDLLEPLVEELEAQTDEILIYANDVTPEMWKYLKTAPAKVTRATGWDLHRMWNDGIKAAHHPFVAVLNDDLIIGPGFLDAMEEAFEPDVMVVSANYDNSTENRELEGICADRYDGTGGLAGFAFMLRTRTDYRFPGWLRWYCGDSHLAATAALRNQRSVMAVDARCVHIGHGSADPYSFKMQRLHKADWDAFMEWIQNVEGVEYHIEIGS